MRQAAIAEQDPGLQDTGERIIPQRARDSIDYAEHTARYLFASRFTAGRRVLDVACGVGYGSKLLAESDALASVIGVDLSEQAVAYARLHHPAANLSYMVGSALQLPFEAASFDLVVSFEFIQHIAEQQQFLREVKRVLHPEGQLIISTPNRWMSVGKNPFHVRELGKSEFAALLYEQFAHVRLFYQSNVLASLLKSGTCLPSHKPDRPGFAAIVGDPFDHEEAMCVVAVCGDQPPRADEHHFEAGISVTRNDEYHKIRNLLDERGRAMGVESERLIPSEQLVQALRSRVQVLEQTLADRERQAASLEERLAQQQRALGQSAATIDGLTEQLRHTLGECRSTALSLTPLVQEHRDSLRLQIEALDHCWCARLETIQKALDQL
jgi:2-polyprenyl-3-methyl-5-hydroxy-6-metoxy-1,4-benzoquinol methylase